MFHWEEEYESPSLSFTNDMVLRNSSGVIIARINKHRCFVNIPGYLSAYLHLGPSVSEMILRAQKFIEAYFGKPLSEITLEE